MLGGAAGRPYWWSICIGLLPREQKRNEETRPDDVSSRLVRESHRLDARRLKPKENPGP